jgi:lipopolysaccharide export system ATP-binding protein
MDSLLEVDSVLKSYGQKRILADVYMNCRTGDIIGIMGRNGSGKSTFLKILFGTLMSDNCFIRINSQYCSRVYQKKGVINYLHQNSFLPRNITVKKAINLFNLKKAQFLMADPVIKKSTDTRISELAGGERRYLEVMLILESGTQFILLDEPFNGMSPMLVDQIKQKISEKSTSSGIILTDHSYRNVLDISTRNYLLSDGALKLVNDKEDLMFCGYLPSS